MAAPFRTRTFPRRPVDQGASPISMSAEGRHLDRPPRDRSFARPARAPWGSRGAGTGSRGALFRTASSQGARIDGPTGADQDRGVDLPGSGSSDDAGHEGRATDAEAGNPPGVPDDAGPAEWEGHLVSVRDETPTVRSFSFELPTVPFAFRPGQYLVVRLPGVTDPRGDARTFSISSAPSDRGAVTVTTRVGPSPFKQRLFGLPVGATAELWGPFGTFTPDLSRAAVLVGGGIGITPFRSVIREAAARRSTVPIVLLYSSRSVAEIVYRTELEDVARRWAPLRLVLSVSRPPSGGATWSGRTGRIDAAMVKGATRDLVRPRYYLCGPPKMVEDLGTVLVRDAGVPPDDLRTELFQGY